MGAKTVKALIIYFLSISLLIVSNELVSTLCSLQPSIVHSQLLRSVRKTETTKEPSFFSSSHRSKLRNLTEGFLPTQQARSRGAPEVPVFLPKQPVSISFLLPRFTSKTSSNRAAKTGLFFVNKRGKLGKGSSKLERHLAAAMEERQREILNPALVKLDNFCRFLLSKNDDQNNTNETMRGDSWKHTMFPLAFQVLMNSLSDENSGNVFSCLKDEDADILRERINSEINKGEVGDASVFHLFSNLISKVVGIPFAPERKHELPKNGTKVAVGVRTTAAEDALELPATEMIEFIAKQIRRFPYGLLSVARARKRRKTGEKPTQCAETEEAPKTDSNNTSILTVPQVLTVSPFWIADQNEKKPNNTTSSLKSARQRVIDSVAQLDHVELELPNEKGNSNNITPFPTTFWLCDDRLTAKISEVELTGWIKEMENGALLENREMQDNVINDNIRFILLRWLLIPKNFLVHFYTSNQRCNRCREQRPEGHIFFKNANENHHCSRKEPEDAAAKEVQKFQTSGEVLSENRGQCEECSECSCKLCKLLQCHRLRGVGGLENFCRIRCLHMQYAFHLACPTTLGNMIDDLFGVYSCVE